MSNGLLVVQPNPNPIKLHSALQIFLKYAVVRDEALQAPQLLLEAHGAADVALQPLDGLQINRHDITYRYSVQWRHLAAVGSSKSPLST